MCDPSFKQTWASATCPVIVRSAASATDGDFTTFYFGPPAQKPFPFCIDKEYLARQDAHRILRNRLAPAFGSELLWPVTSQLGYVLTPDIALKHFMIRERHLIRLPALLQGDTGTDKVECSGRRWRRLFGIERLGTYRCDSDAAGCVLCESKGSHCLFEIQEHTRGRRGRRWGGRGWKGGRRKQCVYSSCEGSSLQSAAGHVCAAGFFAGSFSSLFLLGVFHTSSRRARVWPDRTYALLHDRHEPAP